MNNTRRLWLILMSVGLFFSYGTSAEEEDITKPEVKVADKFTRGDVISADTFNKIFRTIEDINKVAQDEDIEGSWICSGLQARGNVIDQADGWKSAGILYKLDSAQLTFSKTADTSTIETAGTVTSSAPSVLWSNSSTRSDASNLNYSMVGGVLYVSDPFDNKVGYDVRIVNSNTISLSKNGIDCCFRDSLICKNANAIPASPISPSATNKKTSVDVAWTDVSDDETGFNVYRTLLGEETATLVAQVTEATYTDNDLEEGQAASYAITSYNDNGESAKSKAVTATLDSIAPTLVSTTPANGDDIATDDRQLTLTFNEKVEVFCPSDPSAEMMECATDARAVTGNWLDDRGNERTFSIGTINSGFGGSLTISGSMMGSAELFGANQSVTATVNKAVIRDVNGNVMESDYEFTFTVNDTQNNPNCPPNC